MRLARRLGLRVERVNQRRGFFALLRGQMVSLQSFWKKIRRGLAFQARLFKAKSTRKHVVHC